MKTRFRVVILALIAMLCVVGHRGAAFQVYQPNVNPGDYIQNAPPTAQGPIVHWDLRQYNSCTIPWSINFANIPDVNADAAINAADQNAVTTALQNAAATWTNATPGMAGILQLQVLGAVPAAQTAIARDNFNVMSFANPVAPAQDDQQCVAVGGLAPAPGGVAANRPFAPVVSPGAIDFLLNTQPLLDDMILPCIVDGGNTNVDSTAVADDVQIVAPGGAVPGGCNVILTAGPNGTLDTPVNNTPVGVGDDRVSACVVAGTNGTSNTPAQNQGAAAPGGALTGLFFNNQSGVILETDIEFGPFPPPAPQPGQPPGWSAWSVNNNGQMPLQYVVAGPDGDADTAVPAPPPPGNDDIQVVAPPAGGLGQTAVIIRPGANRVIDTNVAAGDRLVVTGDLQSTAAHELGHTIGIAHPVNGRTSDDIQVVATGGAVAAGGLVISAGFDNLLATQPQGDDLVLGNRIIDGGNLTAETTANNAQFGSSPAAGATNNIMNPFYSAFNVTNQTPSVDDQMACNWMYTPDLGDADDGFLGTFNEYQTLVHTTTQVGTLNGQGIFQVGQGPVHLFGYEGPANPSGRQYQSLQFEWLGTDVDDNQNECEALEPDEDLFDDGVVAPVPLVRGAVNRFTVTITTSQSPGRYVGNDDVCIAALGNCACGNNDYRVGLAFIGAGPNNNLDTPLNNCAGAGTANDATVQGWITTGTDNRTYTTIPAPPPPANDDVWAAGGPFACNTAFVNAGRSFIGPGPDNILQTPVNNCPGGGNDAPVGVTIGTGTDTIMDTRLPAAPVVQPPATKRLYFNGYFDFDGDGKFDPADRLIWWSGVPNAPAAGPIPAAVCTTFANSGNFVAPANPTDICSGNTITLDFDVFVPANAANEFYARYRLDYGEDEGRVQDVNGDNDPAEGVAQFGEVEDYVYKMDSRICISVFRYGGAASGWIRTGPPPPPLGLPDNRITAHVDAANRVFAQAGIEWVWGNLSPDGGAIEDLRDPFGAGNGDIAGGFPPLDRIDEGEARAFSPDLAEILKLTEDAECYPVVFVNGLPNLRGMTVVSRIPFAADPYGDIDIGRVTLVDRDAFPTGDNLLTLAREDLVSTLAHEQAHALCLDPGPELASPPLPLLNVPPWGDGFGHPDPIGPPPALESDVDIFGNHIYVTWGGLGARSGDELFSDRQIDGAHYCEPALRARFSPSFSVAPFGPSTLPPVFLPDNFVLWSPAVPTTMVPLPVDLGLGLDGVDGLSYGKDFSNGRFPYKFSVDYLSLGLPGTAVSNESGKGEAHGDEFAGPAGPPPRGDPPTIINLHILDEGQFGLAVCDDVDGVIQDSPAEPPLPKAFGPVDGWIGGWLNGMLDPGERVYFSVAPGAAAGLPADVLVVTGADPAFPAPPLVYAPFAALGLTPADDIDALCVYDNPAGDPDLFEPAIGDRILFSLTRASPSAAGPISSADVLAPGPVVVTPAAALGLIGGNVDELNALKCYNEIDAFPLTDAVVTVRTPSGTEDIRLSGPSTVAVDIALLGDEDGNGLEEVPTEMIELELTGDSTLFGPVTVRVRPDTVDPFKKSTGVIEEKANNTPGVLDIPPFTQSGSALSTFDMYFEIEVAGEVYHNTRPKHMRTTITEKPPKEGEKYESPEVIPLYDSAGLYSGIDLLSTKHTPRPKERDHFPKTRAKIDVFHPVLGSETITLTGPTTVEVDLASLADTDGDGLEQVTTEIVEMELTGDSTLFGPVVVRVRPDTSPPLQKSTGEIEENSNDTPGTLDLPPFTETGAAQSFYDVYFEIEVLGEIYHNEAPKRQETEITEKPPKEGEKYEAPDIIPLFDEAGLDTGIEIRSASHTPRPKETDYFEDTHAEIDIEIDGLGTETITLTGPTTVEVDMDALGDTDGNTREEVPTEITDMYLTGYSNLLASSVVATIRSDSKPPFLRSTGQIEETNNATPGVLDLPPFADAGTAQSDFDVYFEIQVAGMTLHNNDPKHQSTQITEKPPKEGEKYEAPEVIELFDENDALAGVRILNASHTPKPKETDFFPDTEAKIGISSPFGDEIVTVSGPTTVEVNLAALGDTDGNARESVPTEITNMHLTGYSSLFGPIVVRVRPENQAPFQKSVGEIEETTNATPGRLDLPPFTQTGSANSYYDVYFEIELADGTLLHNEQPKRQETQITEKPPKEGEKYEAPEVIALFYEDGTLSDISLANASHTPRPPDRTPDPHDTVFGLGNSSTNFGNEVIPPIPAGFFGPGSDAFVGDIAFDGASLGTGPFISASTLLKRSDDPVLPADPEGTVGTVEVELVALSLVSIEPITVTYTGGPADENWDVTVTLSDVPAGKGWLTATKTHCNGGVFDMTLPVNPKLIFTNAADPTDVRVLDAAVEGEPPIELTVQNAPWVHSIWDPNVQIEAPFDGTFVPGVEESPGCSGPGQKNGAGAAQAVRLDLRADVAGSVMTSALRPVAPTLQASETDADPAIAGWDSQVPPGLVECPGRAVIHPQRVAPTYDGARARQTGPGRATALVYQNTYTQFDFYYAPGANVTVGDDMQLAGTARIFNRYEHVCVWSNPGTPNYDVTMELWDGSAAGPTSPISGTACTVANIPPGTVWDAASLCDSGVGPGDTLPDLVWMLVTFSTNEAGWVVAQEAEVGFTDDVYWENGSLWWWEGNPYAGLCGWVYCDDDVSTVGACCLSLTDCFDGTTSSECEVLGGIWMGGGTDCTTVTCQCFSDAECDDGNACTTDICDLANGVCQNTPTYDPATMCCDPATGQLTVIDDGEPCTDDICDPANGTVAHLPLPNGSDCDDGDACAVFDVCFNGVCAGVDCTTIECLSAADCIECPGGQCDPATGTCSCGPIPGSQTVQPITLVNSTALTSHTVVPLSLPAGPCDGQPAGTVCRPAAGECDVDEVCDGVTPDCPPDAYAPAGTDCGDPGDTDCDNPDTCDGAGSCLPNTEPDGTPCDDGLVCTTDDVCDGLLGLCTGTDINGIPCTVDADCPPPGFCVPDLGQCLCVDEQMRFHPVDATGNVVSLPGMGDESAKIVLSEGGVDVTLFFQVSNWDAFGRDLGALQGTLDSTSLLGGVPGNPGTIPGVDLIPRGSSTGMGFEGAFQALKVCASLPSDPVGSSDLLSRCDTSADCPPTHPFCVDRWDYVFYQLNSVPAVSTSSPNYVWGAASFPPCRTDPSAGERFYLGTLVLEVPPEATGTYNVAFLPDDALTEMYDCSGLLIPGPVTRAGTIEIQAGGVFNGLGVPANPDHQTKKHRYISVDATTNLPQEVSLKVEVVEMRRCTGDPRRSCLVDADCRNACQNDLDAFCGSPAQCGGDPCIETGPCVNMAPTNPRLSWFVQAPVQAPSGGDCRIGCGPEDWIARLGPTPHVEDWAPYSTLHIGDCPIVPCVTYTVYACHPLDPTICGDPLVIGTQVMPYQTPRNYGDVAGPVTPTLEFTPPDGFMNVVDIQAWQLTNQNWGTPNKPQTHPTWVDLHGGGTGIPPNYIVNVTDLNALKFTQTPAWPWVNSLGGLDPQDCP